MSASADWAETTPARHRSPIGTDGGASLVVGRALGTVVVSLFGDLDGTGAPYVSAVFDDLIDGQGNLAVIVDLHGLRSLDGTTIEALAAAANQVARRGGQLALARPAPDVADLLVATGLAGLLTEPHPTGVGKSHGDEEVRLITTPPSLHPAGSNARRGRPIPSPHPTKEMR